LEILLFLKKLTVVTLFGVICCSDFKEAFPVLEGHADLAKTSRIRRGGNSYSI